MRFKSVIVAMTALASWSGAAVAQTDARRAAERDMLKRAVEIPGVAGRGQMDEMTAMLATELRKAGIRDIVIRKHGDTEALSGLFFRAAGIPVYGAGALWGFVHEPLGAHGLNERIRAEAFHDNIDHWERMLRELGG